MNLCNINHTFNYETEKLCRLFLPFEKINILDYKEPAELYAVTEISGNKAYAELHIGDKSAVFDAEIIPTCDEEFTKLSERVLAQTLYKCFCEATGYTSQWGILTGVRPAKLYSSMVRNNSEEYAEKYFKKELCVSDKKVELCKATSKSERAIVEKSTPKSFSLYISVPFCPTRCAYCSFVSHSVMGAEKLIPEYLEKLKEEINFTGGLAKQLGLKLETVYIGGGTPTTLTALQLTELMDAIKTNFDLSGILEYTVEAGRPDTIDEDKLRAILSGGATRISINPQTMNDAVLSAVGRRHTAGQTRDAYALARQVGFKNINMDLIAGLPTDTYESFKRTIDEIVELSPENVTVHSLSMKRASNLTAQGVLPEIEAGAVASDMVDYAKERLTEAGIIPYYMYRQSKTVGNLENVGYAKKGYEGYYNVYIMDETHSILACGASAVTKLREPHGKTIERVFNYKYPYEYISGFQEIIKRKQKIELFYKKYPLEKGTKIL